MPFELLDPVNKSAQPGFQLIGPADSLAEVPPLTVPPVPDVRAQRLKRVAEFDAGTSPISLSASEFGRGVAKGALGMGSGVAGFGEALAGLVGAASAKAWLKEKGDSLEELNRSIPQAVESFTQIRNPADIAAYTLAAIGELAPQIVTSLGAGLGLKAAGLGVKTAAVIGAAATSYPQEAGGIYRGIREETGKDAPLTALGFGIPAAALDTLTPARFLGKVFGGQAGDKLKQEGWRALVNASFNEAVKTGAIESPTELGQEGIALLANKFADSTYPLLTEKNGIRMLDAGLKGFIGGTAIGGTSPALQRLNAPQRVETGGIDDTPPVLVEKLTDVPSAPSRPATTMPAVAPTLPAAGSQPKPPPYAPPTISQQPGAVTEPARDVPVVSPEGPTQRAPVLNRGLLLGPEAQPPSPPVTPPVAPAVPVPVAEPTPPPPPTGPRWQAQTPGGEATVSGVWRVGSVRDLVTSFDPGYDPTLQPRDRSRIASQEQIARIATQLDVNRLGESATTNLGAPLSDASRQILSGNGRVTALRSIYDAGGRAADEYRAFVRQRAADLGLNADEVSAIPDPVLYREVSDYAGLDPVRLSNLSNQSDVMGMSAGEKAVSDTRMLERTPALLDLFRPSEDGDVLAASNREFLNRFIQATGDQAVLMSAEDYNGPVLSKRVRNAMTGLLVGAEDSMLMRNLLEEAEDTGIKRVADAVIGSVPLMMRLRGTAYDLGPAIAQALRDLVRIRKSGERLEEFLGQSLMFADPQRSILSDKLLRLMHSGKSVKALLGVFERYSTLAREAVADQSSGGLFVGDAPRTREQLLQAVYERTSQTPKADQADFTFRQPQTVQAPATVPGRPAPESDRPTGQAGPLASMGPSTAPTFYSRLQRTVEESKQAKASGAQWKSTIRNKQPNADEFALVGVDNLEDARPYTKAEVLAFLRDNEIQVREVTLGTPEPGRFKVEYNPTEGVKGKPYLIVDTKTDLITTAYATKEEADDHAANFLMDPAPYSQYQLGGGEPGTYREWVLHVPDSRQIRVEQDAASGWWLVKDKSGLQVASGKTREDAIQNAREYDSAGEWHDGHSAYADIPNPVVRLRGAIHQTVDGKRMLLIEEVQTPTKGNFEKMPALFQSKWRDIGFKFALRKAAELGADTLGWTTGQQQVDRYPAVKTLVDKITWSILPDNRVGQVVTIYPKQAARIQVITDANGTMVQATEKKWVGEHIGRLVGKEIAEKIQGQHWGQLEGEGLTVGGEGLLKLYDVDFRNVVNGLPSVKRAGVKVGTAEIETKPKRKSPYTEEGLDLPPQFETVHALPLTPEMKAAAMQGQPLAAVGPANVATPAPEASVPFTLPPSGILRNLANLPFTPTQKAVFDALIKTGFGRVPFRLINDPTARYGGGFVGAKGFVLNVPYLLGRTGYTTKVVIHEAVHAATYAALRDKKFQKQSDRLNTLLEFTREKSGYNKTRGDWRVEFQHALRNVDEFIAAALTSQAFRKYLATLRPTSRSWVGKAGKFVGSVLDQVWKIISSIVGVKPSVLSEALALTDELIGSGLMTEKDLGNTDHIPTVTDWTVVENNPAVRRAVPPSSDPGEMPSFASLGPTLKAADLEKTIAFTPDPATRTTEAVMASGQTTGLLGVLRDHIVNLANQFIPAGLTPAERQRRMARAASVVNVARLEGIENVAGTLGVTPQQFDAAYQAMPDAGMKTLLAKHWFDQFNLIERNARRTAAARQEAADKVSSPGFQQKLRNLRVQINRRDVAEQARKLIVAQLKNGLDQARARIGHQGVNETMFAAANEQIRMFTELLQRVDPIERRMEEIIRTANNNQALFTGIVDGSFATSEDLLNAYLATNPTLPGPGPEMVELRVAADILHRTRTLAQRMTAAIASEDAAVNQAVTDLEGRIRHSVDAGSYRTVINNVLRKVVSYASKEGKAAAIIKITQAPLLRQIEHLESLEFGEAVFGSAMADPRYRTMRNRANELVGAFPRPAHALKEKGEPLTPLSSPFLPEHTVYLPDGTTATFKMSSKKADWDAQRQDIDDALSALTAWLAANPSTDPAHDIYRSFYQWEFDTLNTLWHASFAFDSPKMFPAFRNFHFKMVDSMLKMFDSLADSIGTRDINLAKSLAGILKDVMHQMSDWSSKNSQNITHTMYLAVRSHPDIARGNTLDGAARTWFREVLNPIFASLRNPGKPGYRTGDIIASSGRKITRQDMDAARRQAKSTAAAMAINVAHERLNYATPPLVEDRIIPGAPALRRVLTLSPMMVPRRFGADGRSVASQFIARVILGQMTPQEFWRDLNRFHHVKSMVEDRSEEYSTVSPLQLEDAFRAAKAELQNDPSTIDDMQSLAAFMAQHTTATPDEIEAFIGSEMTRSVNAFINAIPDLQQQKKGGPVPEFDIKSWEQANAFTLGRGKALAPPSFYEYGFKDTAGILNFATSGNSFYMDQFVQSLREIAAKMRTYRDTTIKERTDELVRMMGETKGTEKVRSENRDNIRLGTETLLWEKVDEYANSLDGFVKTFNANYTVGGKEIETQVRSADNMLSRLVGGILSGIVGTVRNAIDGGFYHNGVRLSRLESSTLRAFPRAAYHVLKTTIPLMGRTTLAGLKGVGTVFGQVPSALMTLARTRNFLKFEGQLFGKAIDDVADSMFGVRELNQQLKNRGLAMHVTPSETVENIADFWRSSGVNREIQMSGNPFGRFMQTVGQALGAAVDVQLALFAKPFFPRIGDLIANEAVSGATLGALKNFEKRFRILADTYRQMGITGAALANRQFTAKEVFGSFPGMGTTAEDLRLLEQWFVESNVDFHRSLADWFRRLETDPSAQWLTSEEKWRLAVRSVEVVNAATPFNRPLALRDNFLTRMIGLVLGWNIHAYRQQAAYIGQSADNPNSQFRIRTAIALWMLVALAVADASNEGTELLVRLITRLMGDPERSTRLPHEFEATSDQLKSHLVYAFNSVPFVANVVNAALNDQPNRAAFSTSLLIQSKLTDLINYVGGVIQTGDVTYRLAPLVRGFVPLPGLAVALNQLPEAQGLKSAIDTTRLLTRYADKEALARTLSRGPGAASTATPLTPFGDRIISAIGRGDDQRAEQLYSEAIQVARRIGKADPEASVRAAVISRLPISRALRTTPSAADYSRWLARMSPNERDKIEAFTSRAEQGLSMIGIDTGKLRPLTPTRTTGGTRGRTARSRSLGYRTTRTRRVRLGGSRRRSRLGTRRRRNNLVRAAV